MTTKQELIAQIKSENPKMIANVNGQEVELSVEEYNKAANDWAEMRLKQIAYEEATLKAEADKKAAQAKLAALGLTVDDLKALGL